VFAAAVATAAAATVVTAAVAEAVVALPVGGAPVGAGLVAAAIGDAASVDAASVDAACADAAFDDAKSLARAAADANASTCASPLDGSVTTTKTTMTAPSVAIVASIRARACHTRRCIGAAEVAGEGDDAAAMAHSDA
jgi:hypothetical protein